MGIARLFLEYLQVLAWPAVVVFAVTLFREPITAILHRIKNASLPGGVTLDLSEEVQEAQQLSEQVRNALSDSQETPPRESLPLTEANTRMINLGLRPSPSGLDFDYYAGLARQDPALALAGLRMELEIMGRNVASGFKVEIPRRASAAQLQRILFEAQAITPEQRDLSLKIIRLCNSAIHGDRVSLKEALDVIDSARILSEQFVDWLVAWGLIAEERVVDGPAAQHLEDTSHGSK